MFLLYHFIHFEKKKMNNKSDAPAVIKKNFCLLKLTLRSTVSCLVKSTASIFVGKKNNLNKSKAA